MRNAKLMSSSPKLSPYPAQRQAMRGAQFLLYYRLISFPVEAAYTAGRFFYSPMGEHYAASPGLRPYNPDYAAATASRSTAPTAAWAGLSERARFSASANSLSAPASKAVTTAGCT